MVVRGKLLRKFVTELRSCEEGKLPPRRLGTAVVTVEGKFLELRRGAGAPLIVFRTIESNELAKFLDGSVFSAVILAAAPAERTVAMLGPMEIVVVGRTPGLETK